MLVAHDVADRDELVVEAARSGRSGPPLLRRERERVLLLARDAPAFGDVLAGLAHCLKREQLFHPRVREAPAERRVVRRLVPARERLVGLRGHERRTRHRLDAARDEKLALAGDHRVTRTDNRRKPRRAETVHRHARDRLRQSREQSTHARDVAVVLARLVRTAEPHLLDLRLRDTRPVDHGADHEAREVVGAHTGQRAAVAADRGA